MQTRYNKLNENQLYILRLILKFRFVTATLLSKHRATNKSAATKSLKVLLDQGYLVRRYDNSYRLLGKSASYCLAPKGIRELRERTDIDEDRIRPIYKDRTATDGFVEHNLSVMQAVGRLKSLYGTHFLYFTRIDLTGYEHFPDPAPHLYIREKELAGDEYPVEYMLEIFTDTPSWIIKKRIDEYADHNSDEGWLDGSDNRSYPTVLFVVPNKRAEKQLHKYMIESRDNRFIVDEDLVFMTCRAETLLESKDKGIWSLVEENEDRSIVKSGELRKL